MIRTFLLQDLSHHRERDETVTILAELLVKGPEPA